MERNNQDDNDVTQDLEAITCTMLAIKALIDQAISGSLHIHLGKSDLMNLVDTTYDAMKESLNASIYETKQARNAANKGRS